MKVRITKVPDKSSNARKWKHGDGGFLDNYYDDGGPYGVIPLGGDYLTYLQTMPEIPGGVIEPSVVTAALPSKFNGSQAAAARYAEGYQKGAKPVSEAMNRAGQDIFNTVDTVVGLTPTPAGALTWLGHMGADAAEGRWGRVGRDVALAAALGTGARGIGWLRNYIDDATNYGEDLFRAFTDRAPGRVSTNVPPELFNVGRATAPSEAFIAEQAAKDANELARLGRETLLYEPSDTQYYNRLNRALNKEHKAIERDALRDDYLASDAYALEHPKYEIQDLGGGYMLKSLMRGNPLEKQISKNGTVNVNNVRALVGKGSKVEQAVVDKVLASEEFAGKKSIDYNRFRKAVQDELITYERKPNTRFKDYGLDRIGYPPSQFSTNIRAGEMFNEWANRNYENIGYLSDDILPSYRDKNTGEIVSWSDLQKKYRSFVPGSETYTFSSPRIPNGSAKHYDANTLGHSRTYTSTDEPDVLHVMESQSDWAQGGGYTMPLSDLDKFELQRTEEILANNADKYGELNEPRRKMHEKMAAYLRDKIAKDWSSSEAQQGRYLTDNYTSRQIQENLRYAAEKGQKKMRYPTRETAAKIEGYPEREAYFDANGKDVSRETVYTYGEKEDAEIKNLLTEREGLRNSIYRRQEEDYIRGRSSTPATEASVNDEIREYGRYWDIERRLNVLRSEEPHLKPGITKKTIYDYEDILRKYTEFPKQYKKLFKGADVRTVTDPKGNTWYEVDVPENYLKQEWAYEEGGSMILPKMMMDKHSPDKLRKAIANIKAKRMQ